MPTLIEVQEERIYLSTDDRHEILELIEFLAKIYLRLEERKTLQTTIYDIREKYR